MSSEVFGNGKIKISFQIEKKNKEFRLANNFSKPTSLSFRLKLFVETSNHKAAAIHRTQCSLFQVDPVNKVSMSA